MAYRSASIKARSNSRTQGAAVRYASGDANLESHLRGEIEKEKRKTTELQRLLKEKQEQKQGIFDNDKQREIEYLRRKLTTESVDKVA